VRLLAVEGCGAIGKLLDKQDCITSILPIIISFSQVHFARFVYYSVLFRLYFLDCLLLCNLPAAP